MLHFRARAKLHSDKIIPVTETAAASRSLSPKVCKEGTRVSLKAFLPPNRLLTMGKLETEAGGTHGSLILPPTVEWFPSLVHDEGAKERGRDCGSGGQGCGCVPADFTPLLPAVPLCSVAIRSDLWPSQPQLLCRLLSLSPVRT